MNDSQTIIDAGKEFDFGKTSADYARFRDIYPDVFYEQLTSRNLCINGQSVLDVGTGTGVLPRNMYRFGAKWTAVDISAAQIEMAKLLSQGMDIQYLVSPTEKLKLPKGSFDVITACQCFWYFDHEKTAPLFHSLLSPGASLAVMCMEWLPYEDTIAGASEELVLKYSPQWTGAGEIVHPIRIPECYSDHFETVFHNEFKVKVPFTRESWNGRMKSCRGIGASLSPAEIEEWEKEHIQLLSEIAPERFDVLHYIAFVELKSKIT